MWYNDDMKNTIKACVILQNTIFECRYRDGHIGPKNISSIDPNAEIVPISALATPMDTNNAADFM